jgi:hypothetical protein
VNRSTPVHCGALSSSYVTKETKLQRPQFTCPSARNSESAWLQDLKCFHWTCRRDFIKTHQSL